MTEQDAREALRERLAEGIASYRLVVPVYRVSQWSGRRSKVSDERLELRPVARELADALMPAVAEYAADAWDEGNEACCAPAYTNLNPYRAALDGSPAGSGAPCQRRPHYGEPCDCEARLAAVVTHTRTSTGGFGPDYCAECSEAISEWVPWPCSPAGSGGEEAGR